MDPLSGRDAAVRDTALEGVRVLDLSNFLPGPLCTLHLARMGAEVIKIEPPDGDPMRAIGPRLNDRSVLFDWLNAGKRCMTLDLKSQTGLTALLALVDDADVLVEGFRPGVMDRLGCGWATLHARNPRLVMCSITGYGQTGPRADRAGHDINYLAESGVLDQMRADGKPALANIQIADVLGGAMSALQKILGALFGAQRAGTGRYIDVSMTDAMREYHLLPRAWLAAGNTLPSPGADLLTGGTACYNVYQASDGAWLAVGALEHKFWAEFCGAIDQPQLANRHWSLGEYPGSTLANATIDTVRTTVEQKSSKHWAVRFALVDCCVSIFGASR